VGNHVMPVRSEEAPTPSLSSALAYIRCREDRTVFRHNEGRSAMDSGGVRRKFVAGQLPATKVSKWDIPR